MSFDATVVAEEIARFDGVRVRLNEPMSAHTTLGVGGPADVYVEVADEEGLVSVIRYVSTHDVPRLVVGDGANLLVSDRGIRGVVLSLVGDFQRVKVEEPYIEAGAGARLSTVADLAADSNLAGFEPVGVVPGTVGGAIVMNAGTHAGYIDQIVRDVHAIDELGNKLVLSRDECGFSYRSSRFQRDDSLIITKAVFRLHPGDGAEIRKLLERVRRHRAESQPRGKSAGCFFKNPPASSSSEQPQSGYCLSAGKLIEQAGCKGLSRGDAVVSEVHANFIINRGNATARDILALAEDVRRIVKEKTGIELEYEVRIVGEWSEEVKS
ncbi:MAG: UDP-N-acetylmuramate dehydrogenase [Armatimonadota bacterium]|nr:UDP-N-acetylmuramate dehydrogenase [Armatimonadota bacterium]